MGFNLDRMRDDRWLYTRDGGEAEVSILYGGGPEVAASVFAASCRGTLRRINMPRTYAVWRVVRHTLGQELVWTKSNPELGVEARAEALHRGKRINVIVDVRRESLPRGGAADLLEVCELLLTSAKAAIDRRLGPARPGGGEEPPDGGPARHDDEASGPVIGRVRGVSGDVWVAPSADELYRRPRRLRTGDALRRGHWIRTSTRGRVLIIIHGPDGKVELLQTVVAPNSELCVKAYEEQVLQRHRDELRRWQSRSTLGTLFELLKGKVRAVTGSLFGTRWDAYVRTRNATVGIRGTELVLHSDPKRQVDAVYVREGTVDVATKSGSCVVAAGEQVRVGKGGVLGRVEPLDDATYARVTSDLPELEPEPPRKPTRRTWVVLALVACGIVLACGIALLFLRRKRGKQA